MDILQETITKQEIIKWSASGLPTRKAVCELCGWRNTKGHATPMGLRIANTEWEHLTSAARNVLRNHGIEA